ncbi:MAG: Protease synthase and sporulation negative regulatory protein 1 [Pseudomonadota bacterium]
MDTTTLTFRSATVLDAEPVAALAIQVFLDTYATEGVRPDLADEVFSAYGPDQFEQRLQEPGRTLVLATQGAGIVGFAEVLVADVPSPVAGCLGAELVRLYVQPRAQGRGLGRALMAHAEARARKAGASGLWLTAWEHNTRALGFYDHLGYVDVGPTAFVIQARSYVNRVLHKRLAVASN